MIKTSALIKQLNESVKNLSEANKKIFIDIAVYMRMSNVRTRDVEEFLQQILDSFLNAEQQGISIETVLGTSNIKQYCEEIVMTYKSSCNYRALYSEHIMDAGMFIVVLSVINYLIQNFSVLLSHGAEQFSCYLNFDPTVIFQFLIVAPMVGGGMYYLKQRCFKESYTASKIKEFLILWGASLLFICLTVVFVMFVEITTLFKLNIFIVLLVGGLLYLTGHYLTEKQ